MVKNVDSKNLKMILGKDMLEKISELKVIKRDGRVVKFDVNKIQSAILKAVKQAADDEDIDTDVYNLLMVKICNEILDRFTTDIKIYEIQSIVEKILIDNDFTDIAELYINYRVQRDIARQNSTNINYRIKDLLQKKSSVVNENANKDSNVFNTQRDLTAGIVAKSIGLKMLPPHVANAHQKGQIHVHDLDYNPYTPMTNCCLIDFKGMLSNGFKIGNAEVESPKSIQTATAQMAQIIANVASSQYGGTTADRVDELLAPYAEINYEKNLETAREWIESETKQIEYAKAKTIKDIYDAMQSLEYEINTLYTSQGQTPFTTLGFGLGTSWIEREIQKAILQVRIKGIGKEHRTAIFPKLIFSIKKGVNLKPEDPNYDIKKIALKCSTQRMYPDVLMYDKLIELTGSFKAPMGCRSFLQGWWDEEGNEVNNGRMNLGVVTLNLPRIAIEASKTPDTVENMQKKFWEIFFERLDIQADALLYRIKRVKEALPENAPILYMYGAFGKRLQAGANVDQLFNKRRATVSMGYIGLYEVATAFYGNDWEQNQEAKDFTLEIVKALKQKADELSQKYDYHFSVYSTPSESLTDRFCKLDKKEFGSIPDITDKDYYTNSFHYDVRKSPTPFEKIDFEKDYPKYVSGGFIHYCEYPNMRQNPKALEAVWDYAYDKVAYLGTNTPIDHCYECGFDGEFKPTKKGFECPQCKNTNPATCDVVKRTCGYLGNPQQRPMVHGRHEEIKSRVKHIPADAFNRTFVDDGENLKAKLEAEGKWYVENSLVETDKVFAEEN